MIQLLLLQLVKAALNTTDNISSLPSIFIDKLQAETGVRISVTEFMDVDRNCETINDLSDADIINSSETEAEEAEEDIPEEPKPTAKEV